MSIKNWPQRLLIISLDPYISKSSPEHSPKPRIDFSYYEISGPDICSLICEINTCVSSIFQLFASEFGKSEQNSLRIPQEFRQKSSWIQISSFERSSYRDTFWFCNPYICLLPLSAIVWLPRMHVRDHQDQGYECHDFSVYLMILIIDATLQGVSYWNEWS